MLTFDIKTPTRAYLVDPTPEDLERLRKELTYTNTAASYDVKRHYKSTWFRRNNPDGWEKKLEELKSKVKNTLIFEDGDRLYVRPSSLNYISDIIHQFDDEIVYPEPKKIAWHHPLPFDLYPYQQSSVEELLRVKHGNVELCTGAGKTAIILKLCRETGFRTAIVAPSTAIFEELVEKFEYHFGKGQVGTYGNGKKKPGKRF